MPKIILNNIALKPHKAFNDPDFKSKAVHVSDVWSYTESWLRVSGNVRALNLWVQAKAFKKANDHLDKMSQPLTSYYCILNAVKSLLVSKGVDIPERIKHGLTGRSQGKVAALTNEIVILKQSGVLGELCRYYGLSVNSREEIDLNDLLYNLAFIHRAYCTSVGSRRTKELFIPLEDVHFYKKDVSASSNNTYFCASLTNNWSTTHSKKKVNGVLPPYIESRK